MKKTIYTLVFLALSFTAGAQALPFTAADYDAAVMAKGGAFMTETSGMAFAAFGNPAAAPFAEKKFDAAVGYSMWQPSGVSSNIISAAGTFVMKEKIGVSLGVTYGMNQAYDMTDASGLVTGSYTPSDIQVNAGLSWKFLPFLSVGANIGYASSTLAEGASYGAVNADVFAMVKFGGLKASAGIKSLGSSVKSASGVSFALPMAAAAGVGYTTEFGEKNHVDVNVDAEYYIDGGVAVAGGASYSFAKLATVRAGYRYGGNTVFPSYASVGAGVCLLGAHVDLAYLIGGKSSPMANTLCLSAGWAF